jgi:hypothetical protein
MTNTGISTLLNKTGTLVGFGFQRSGGTFTHCIIYRTEEEYVICMSTGHGMGQPEKMRPHLGSQVPGREFARFATRGVDIKFPLNELREILETTLAGKWEWEWQ